MGGPTHSSLQVRRGGRLGAEAALRGGWHSAAAVRRISRWLQVMCSRVLHQCCLPCGAHPSAAAIILGLGNITFHLAQFHISGGRAPLRWRLLHHRLPAGSSLDALRCASVPAFKPRLPAAPLLQPP